MKKLKQSLPVAVAGLVILLGVSCNDSNDEYNYDYLIGASETGLSFYANETAGRIITVTTQAPQWIAFSENGWIETVQSGNRVTVYVDENGTGVARNGSVTLRAKGAMDLTIPVSQTAEDGDYIDVENRILEFPGEELTHLVEIKTNLSDWTVSKSGNEEWLAVERDGGNVKISLQQNWDEERSATLVVRSEAGKREMELFVIQSVTSVTTYLFASIEFFGATFGLNLYNDPYSYEGLLIEGISSEDSEIPTGVFTVNYDYTTGSVVPGVETSVHDFAGTCDVRVDPRTDWVATILLVNKGKLEITELDNGDYLVTADFGGELLDYNTYDSQTVSGMAYRYEGPITVE